MKKKKTIKIRTPQLQKIRNNLRKTLIEGVVDKLDHLRSECHKLDRDNNGNVKHMNDTEQAMWRQLYDEYSKIKINLKNSICECATCSATDRDMTYSPRMKAWFCTECYQLNQQFYKHSHPELYP